MQLTFESINSLVIHPFTGVDDPRLKKNLQNISQNFTINRDKLSQYLENDEMVSAYTLFYMPTGFVKFSWLMKKLDQSLAQSFSDYDFIDLGSGPGTYSAAFLDYVGEGYQGSVYAHETSPFMSKQAKETIKNLFPKFLSFSVNTEMKSGRKKILFFGNSFNEMGNTLARSYIKKFDPSVIIFLEPGTKDVFSNILPMREELIKSGFQVAYPCPNHKQCPMEGKDDWCHQVMKTTHHPSIEQLSQILQKDRRSMPMVAHVYVKDSVVSAQNRIVRIMPPTKFSYEFQLCRENTLVKVETMKKKYNKDQKSIIEELSFGDKLELEVEKVLPDGKLRAKIHE
ncbi:MAG: small ribosomal subunit Rsm22 family protein [Bacteriovoracaceae bacterium]